MNVMIAFGTVEGQTGKIAQHAAEKARAMDHTVTLFDTSDKLAPVALEDIDHVVLAASVHERRHPQPFEVFVGANRKQLAKCKTLMLSVSLSAAFEDGMDDAQDYLAEMKMRTEFEPDAEMLVAGAVKSDSYDYFASQVVRHVVLKDRDYDPNLGEHEFTDWEALDAGLERFLS